MAIFMNLNEIAVNKNLISPVCEEGKWSVMPYKTKLGEGKFIYAGENITPEDNMVFNLNLEGWHRIYLCMVNFCSDTYTHVKLSGDLCFSGMRTPPRGNPCVWMPYEYMQEFYWKSADLTGQQIIMKKPVIAENHISNLVWIRCEKMSDEEIEAYNSEPERCIQGHIDVDPFVEEKFEDLDSTLIKIETLKNSNIDFCTFEIFAYGDQIKTENFIPMRKNIPSHWPGNDFDREELYKKHIGKAHEYGMKAYAGLRMCAGNFTPSGFPEYYNKNFFRDNTQLYCRNRDDSVVKVCSYAYPETREYVINNLLDNVRLGFDGVTLIYMRGMHIGFEQPVLDRFEELYPGINPKLLPFTDERLHGVWCEFMTVFMKELRERLDSNIKINVITDYGLATSKHLGLDVEKWASLGLIDSASQADMEIYEDLEGCLKDDGTIDMDKYIEKSMDTEIIKRNYGTDIDRTCSHIKEYLELKKYGIEVYNILPWVHTRDINTYKEYVDRMKKLGAEKFLAWNTNHMEWNFAEYNTVRFINNEKIKVDDVLTYYRTLSIDGSDISSFSPNWKG